jgi:hypothetical protein
MKEKKGKFIFFFNFFFFSLKLRVRFDLGVISVKMSERKLYINLLGVRGNQEIKF